MSHKILMVCLGNICRSPTAEAVVRAKVQRRGLDTVIEIDSAGTGDWHVGRAPDARSQQAALLRGYDLSACRARLVNQSDFDYFDQILAMDQANLSTLQAMASPVYHSKIQLFLSYAPDAGTREVPDPYQGQADGFERVLDLIELAADGLLNYVQQELRLSADQPRLM